MSRSKTQAENLVSRFLTEVPFVEGKPYPKTEDAKVNAIIAANWLKDLFSGELHKKECEELIKEIKLIK